MVQKRPFAEELYEVSSKHLRQYEHSGHLVSFLEFPSEDVGKKPHTSGEGKDCITRNIPDHDEEPESGNNIVELPKEDFENSSPGGISNSSWASSCTSEEDVRLEAPFHILVSPKYYDPDRPTRTLVHSEDTYSSLLEHPPRKLVSVGPEFQADVPIWCTHGANDTSICLDSTETLIHCPQASGSNLSDRSNDENKFSGTCVIPMPGQEPSACCDDRIGDNRILCCCEYPGSVRCVRQHIIEARENLKRAVGQEGFVELGFCDMGEIVAEKWSEEDQQLFQELVFSNRSSLGKNFWDLLSAAFPFRSKKEIVSYYFNVFMLRIRAEQNRCEPLNIDSDDDEWQEETDDEYAISEEDEDSVVESPVCQGQGIPGWSEIHEDSSHEYANGIANAASHRYDVDFVGGLEGITNVSGTFPGKLLNYCRSGPFFHPSEKTVLDERGDQDFNDHSCTSFDTGVGPQVSQIKVDNSKSWTGSFTGVNGEGGHDFFLEPCDAKVWDAGYLTCPRNDVEFLPTCSMIEEVFGVGAWNHKARDGKLV